MRKILSFGIWLAFTIFLLVYPLDWDRMMDNGLAVVITLDMAALLWAIIADKIPQENQENDDDRTRSKFH